MIAPLMLGLIGGFFTFGFAFFTYFQLSNAVDIGARSLAVSRAMNSDGSTPDPCVTASAAIVAAAPALDPSKITLSLHHSIRFDCRATGLKGHASATSRAFSEYT